MAFKRLPNNYGTVTKLPGNRRKPYRAMKRVGVKENKNPIYAIVGYYADKAEALKALSEISSGISAQSPTVEEVFRLWKDERTAMWTSSYETAWKRLGPIHKRKVRDLRAMDLEQVVNKTGIARTMKKYCVVILHGIYDYSMRHEFVQKDYSKIARYEMDNSTRIKRELFAKKEVDELWKHPSEFYHRCVLVMLFTGMRVSEVGDMKVSNIHLDERYMIGGLKTEAGRDRIIPIHKDIVPLIEQQIKIAEDLNCEYAFVSENGVQLNRWNLGHYMRAYGIGHTPHDTRHTFATQAYLCGMDENLIKRILGHTFEDITQQVYIHIQVERLVEEMDKFHF